MTHRVKVAALAPQMSLGPRELRHLRVLRLSEGDTVRVFDGAGGEAEATVAQLTELGGLLTLGEPLAAGSETPQPVTLAVALLKGDKLADVVRAGTELGVGRFRLLQTQHADVPEIGPAKLERLRRVAGEAARQSRRALVPAVDAPIPLAQLTLDGQGFVAHPGSTERLSEHLHWNAPLTLVTGPEGGFAEEEVDALTARGFTPVTLGPRILRAQTAPLALLGAIAASGV